MFNVKFWIKVSLINILIVAFLGLVMRYKIAFPLPYIEQKNLLHAHSHFAFAGWVSQTLIALLTSSFLSWKSNINTKKYSIILLLNLLISYAMIFSFSIQGYGVFSIILCTLSILIFYIFGIFYIKDLLLIKEKMAAKKWYIFAIVLGIFSTLGTFMLAQTMVSKSPNQQVYLGALYFYLHFQYNGWFLFACIGLFYDWLQKNTLHFKENKYVFILLAASSIPCYFLSTLWAKLPLWLYAITIFAVIAQTVGWLMFAKNIFSKKIKWNTLLLKFNRAIFFIVLIALSIKFLLQLFSVIPSLSHFAFGHRSIVIGYLHLILLGGFTLFFFAYFLAQKIVVANNFFKISLTLFIIGIIANEIVLMLQGLSAFTMIFIKNTNEILVAISFLMFIGLLLINFSQKNNKLTNS